MSATVLLPDIEVDFDFWQFAGRLYARPGVAARLLQHQDVDVIWINDWLFAAWQAAKGNILHADYRTLITSHTAWRQAVIVPWRAWRHQLRPGADTPTGYRLYHQVLQAELALEWHDQAWLWRQAGRLALHGGERTLVERLQTGL